MKSRWTRRRFVGAATRTTAVVTLPAWALGCSGDSDSVAPDPLVSRSRSLQRIAYLLFPFPDVGPEPYERVAAAIEAAAESDPAIATLVAEGIAALENTSGPSWLDIDVSEQIASLEAIEGEPFFNYVFDTTKVQLFNDRTIWAHIGFDPGAPLNDIDWLGDT